MIENMQMVMLLGGVFVSVWIASALYRRGMRLERLVRPPCDHSSVAPDDTLAVPGEAAARRSLGAAPILIPAWLCFLSYAWVRALDRWWHESDDVHVTVSRLQESAELILYAGALAFLVIVLLRVRAGKSPSLGPNRSL